jgi:hypothetical protein
MPQGDLLKHLLEEIDREYPITPSEGNLKRKDLLDTVRSHEFQRAVTKLQGDDIVFLASHLPALTEEYYTRIREERGAPFPYTDNPELEDKFSKEVDAEAAQWVSKAAWVLIPWILNWRRWNDTEAVKVNDPPALISRIKILLEIFKTEKDWLNRDRVDECCRQMQLKGIAYPRKRDKTPHGANLNKWADLIGKRTNHPEYSRLFGDLRASTIHTEWRKARSKSRAKSR